jgi:anaerobic ribonucleoside-triphosphate reductase
LDDIFTFDQVDYAPLIENNPEISKEKSIKLFENYIHDFFKKNLKNPRKNKEKKDEVIVFVEIIIENDGIIYEMSSIGPEIYRIQVEKVVKKLPELFPAKIDNYPVAVTYSFPVKFNLK